MRPYIICHMMASLDGRIDCDMTEKLEGSDEYYEALGELELDAHLSGRVTAAMHYAKAEPYKAKDTSPAGKTSFYQAQKAGEYSVVADTMGSLAWEKNAVEGRHLVVILSERAPEEYLDYLKGLGISYIAAGKEGIDLKKAAEILAEEFGVKRLGIVGGGHINGAFLAAGLLDEVSMMYAPGIDGREGMAAVFDGLPMDAEPVRLRLRDVKTYACGTVWMRYEV